MDRAVLGVPMPADPVLKDPIATLRDIAETPKQGEPKRGNPHERVDYTDDFGRYAVGQLNALIELAREALTAEGHSFINPQEHDR